jgi:hypothetical protein
MCTVLRTDLFSGVALWWHDDSTGLLKYDAERTGSVGFDAKESFPLRGGRGDGMAMRRGKKQERRCKWKANALQTKGDKESINIKPCLLKGVGLIRVLRRKIQCH